MSNLSSTVPNRALPQSGAPKPKRVAHSFWWYLKWFFISIQLVLFCAIVVTVCIGKGLYDQLNKIVPDTRFITSRTKAEPTRVYAADKTLLAEFKGEQREFIPLEQLKVTRQRGGKDVVETGHLINATLSIEDARFYTHPGMDAYRIVGALYSNFKNPDSTQQGGSTITEQLAVNIYLTRTKTLARRLQTALLALQLEKRFTKDEILELYLNEIYYGNRAYGCEAAADRYFGKQAKDLSIAQAAMLAGLPQQPTRLDPFVHFERAKKRQRLVLKAMLENKKINWGQYLAALKDQSLEKQLQNSRERFLAERTKVTKWRSPYFVAYVKQYLQSQYDWSDEFLNKSGLKIYTTLDPTLQSIAEKTMKNRLNDVGGSDLQGSMVCIDPWSGRILAMYGGRDYYATKGGQFNRATMAKRQSGSTFKPFVYATAMEQGYTPDSVVKDEPFKVGKWSPKNYQGRNAHYGSMTFKKAIGQSNNVAAVKVLMRLGIPNVIQKAHMMGLTSALAPYPSLALGASDITLLENTSAYGVFCTRGLRADPTPIIRVDTYAGETLVEQPSPVMGARVLSQQAADRMWEMLRYVVTNGTGTNAQISGVDVIGKTGTTSDNRDVWFMGGTTKLVCGVWMGYDKPRELVGSAGGRWCAPAWRTFMVQALDEWDKRNPVEKMIEDKRATQMQRMRAEQYKKVVTLTLCKESGLIANQYCPDTIRKSFSAAGDIPTRTCDIHGPAQRDRSLDESGGDNNDNNDGTLSVPPDANGDSNTNDGSDSGNADNFNDAPVRAQNTSLNSSTSRRPARPLAPPSNNAPLNVEGDVSDAGNGEVVATICADSGDLATSKCPVTLQQFFLASQVPRRKCRLHR